MIGEETRGNVARTRMGGGGDGGEEGRGGCYKEDRMEPFGQEDQAGVFFSETCWI